MEIDIRLKIAEIVGEEAEDDSEFRLETDGEFYASNEERQELIDAISKTLTVTTFFTGLDIPPGGKERLWVVTVAHARDNIGVV